MLLRTTALAGVEIDARAHRARVRAGARWADVADRASFLGLAPAAGFSRDGRRRRRRARRRHGLARPPPRRRRPRRARRRVRHGRRRARPRRRHRRRCRAGSVITALELALHPADDLYAGALFFSFDRADEVLHAWREWTATAPAEITSVARLMRFADRHDVPELVRGRSFAIVEAAHLGTEAEAAELLAPAARRCAPSSTRSRSSRPSALGHLHMEPEHPEARLADDGIVGELPAAGDRRPRSPSPARPRTRRSRPSSCATPAARWRRSSAGSSRTPPARRPTPHRRPRSRRSSRSSPARSRPTAPSRSTLRRRAGAGEGVPSPDAGSGPSMPCCGERVAAQVRRRRDAIVRAAVPTRWRQLVNRAADAPTARRSESARSRIAIRSRLD